MAEINDLTTVDASNTGRWPENMAPSAVNDAARADEGILARWHKDTNGSLVSTGSANAYVLSANRTISAYYDGLDFTFEANFGNTGAATLNVDSVGAQAIVWPDGTALASGDIPSAAKVRVVYDADNTRWHLLTVGTAPGALYGNDTVDGTEIALGSDAQGDIMYYNGSAWARLGAGTSGDFLQTQGAGANPQWAALSDVVQVLDADPTENEIVDTVTETTLYTYTIPANTLGTDKAIQFLLRGDYLNNAGLGNKTFTLKIKLGATTLWQDAVGGFQSISARWAWSMDLILTAVDSASVQLLHGPMEISGATAPTTGDAGEVSSGFSATGGVLEGSAAEDSTGSLAFTVTITHQTANANISIRRKVAIAKLLP